MDVLIPRAQEVQERCKGSASALGRIETVCPVDKRSSMSGEDTTSELGFLGEAGAELRNRLRAKQIYMEMLLEVLS